MKKKISIYLSQNIFIIVLVFFLSWGLSFLITRDIYSIKDKEEKCITHKGVEEFLF